MQNVDCVEVETGARPRGSIIWLHGLGADGHDFEPVVSELRLPDELPLRFVFPHAPTRPVTINGGMRMRAWYDIRSLGNDGRADEDGIRASGAILEGLIEREIARGIGAAHIVCAGFSQGGAIVLQNALTTRHELLGLVALSTYLPLGEKVSADDNSERATGRMPRLFMAHGTADPMVPLDGGKRAAAVLKRLGFEVEWHEYPMAHGVCPQEIADIRGWLLSVYGISAQART